MYTAGHGESLLSVNNNLQRVRDDNGECNGKGDVLANKHPKEC
jgi:hypothetical protein